MIDALRDEKAADRLIAVCNELLPSTCTALIAGTIDLILATPLVALAGRAVEAMTRAAGDAPLEGMRQIPPPAELYVSENV
jgi:hypothetical protein